MNQISLTGWLLLLTGSMSYGVRDVEAGIPEAAPTALPTDLIWSDLPPDQRQGVLALVSQQCKANYERIHTWAGKYNVAVEQTMTEQQAEGALANQLPPSTIYPIRQRFSHVLSFSADLTTASLSLDQHDTKMEILGARSDKPLKTKNLKPTEGRSILTSEHYVHFNRKDIYPGFLVATHPETMNKHAAFRYPSSQGRTQDLGDTQDPTSFFGTGFGTKIWTRFVAEENALAQSTPEQTATINRQELKISKSSRQGVTWFRHQAIYRDKQNNGSLVTTIFASNAGFNPVSEIYQRNGLQVKSRLWAWKKFSDVFIPSAVDEWISTSEDGSCYYKRSSLLADAQINQPLGPNTFDYIGLGLQNGDIVMDDINKCILVMKHGQVSELVKYNAQASALPSPSMFSNPQTLLILLNVLILIGFFLYKAAYRSSPSR